MQEPVIEQSSFEEILELDLGDLGFRDADCFFEYSTDGNSYQMGSYKIEVYLEQIKIDVTRLVNDFVVEDLFEECININKS